MTAVLSSDMGDSERVAIAIAECRRMGIPVMPPDVNVSRFDFVVSGQEIRFGLGAIKNVGEGAIENIVAAREAGGPFRSLEDLCGRIDLQRNNKRVLESLIKAGACDAFGPRLAQLTRLDAALATGQREQKDRASGQVSLFDLAAEPSIAAPTTGPEASRKELLGWEKELLGIYVSDHPLTDIAQRIGDVPGIVYLAELKEVTDELVTIVCVVTSARKHITMKNKALMLFAQVEDLTGSSEVTVFPRTYEQTAGVWNADEIVLLLARVEQRDETPKLLCEHAVPFTEAGIAEIIRVADERRVSLAKKRQFTERAAASVNGTGNGGNGNGHGSAGGDVVIRFREALDYDRSIAVFQRIQHVLARYGGPLPVYLELPRAGSGMRRVATTFRARAADELSREIDAAVGAGVVDVVLPEARVSS
jgi:DNA polymerase-3 subunit alpha